MLGAALLVAKPDLVDSPDILHCNNIDAIRFSSTANLDKRLASLMLSIECNWSNS